MSLTLQDGREDVIISLNIRIRHHAREMKELWGDRGSREFENMKGMGKVIGAYMFCKLIVIIGQEKEVLQESSTRSEYALKVVEVILNELDDWKPSIALVVGAKIEDEIHTKALSLAVKVPQRKLFSVITCEDLFRQVTESGSQKGKKVKDVPVFYEVVEVAKAILDSGEEIPVTLTGKLLKFQLLCIKQKDLQRRDAEKAEEEQKKERNGGKEKGKPLGTEKPPSAKTTEKERKDDEPDDGAHYYFIILGFYNLQLLPVMSELGVNISSVIRISSENYEPLQTYLEATRFQEESLLSPKDLEAKKIKKDESIKDLETFWKYLEPILNSGKHGSRLFDVARLHHLVKENVFPSDWSDREILVIASEENLRPPSLVVPEERADGIHHKIAEHIASVLPSLPLSKSEKKNLYDYFSPKYREETVAPKYPLLFNYHDTLAQRLHLLKFQDNLFTKKIEREMMDKLPLKELIHFTLPSAENDTERLARVHELMHYCTSELLSWAEVERAFRVFTFESLRLTELSDSGLLESSGSLVGGDSEVSRIPWDNPAKFARQLRQLFLMEMKLNEKSPGGSGYAETNDKDERDGLAGSVFNKELDLSTDLASASLENYGPELKLEEIRKTQKRCLTDWNFAEHFRPDVLLQVLHSAAQEYRCIDSYYHMQDNSLLMVLHNPMNQNRLCQETWDVALHSNVGFRNYLELVANSIEDWVKEEEVKYQEEKIAREIKALKQGEGLTEGPSEFSNYAVKKPGLSKKASIIPPSFFKDSTSRPESVLDTILESQSSNERSYFIREGSLKASKEKRNQLPEEEQLKEEKKTKQENLSGKMKRQETVIYEESEDSSKKSPNEKLTDEPAKVPEPEEDHCISETHPEKIYEFLGYNTGESLIQVSGINHYLFPSDGGQIHVEKIGFVKGLTLVKVKVVKDNHNFFIHITDPKENLTEIEVQEDNEEQKTAPGNIKNQKKAVSKFGSFSATLENGIQLSLSYYGPTGKTADDQTDPVLAAILNIPSVHIPTVPPSTTSASEKKDKSVKQKSGKSLLSTKSSNSRISSSPDNHEKQEGKGLFSDLEDEATTAEAREDAVEKDENRTNKVKEEEVAKEQTKADEAKEKEAEKGKMKANEAKEEKAVENKEKEREVIEGEIKQENTKREKAKQPALKILVRQSYPQKVKNSRLYASVTSQIKREVSRVITSQGTVIRYMMDGSTWIVPSPTKLFISAGKGSDKNTVLHSNKDEVCEDTIQSPVNPELPKENQAGTWITTTPLGVQVMTVRDDKVIIVEKLDGSRVVDHGDGTRITTFYQDCEEHLVPQDSKKTDEPSETITRKVKCIRVENPKFATVTMNCEDGTCCTVFGDGTSITAKPQGTYQVLPNKTGSLFIDEDCSAVYTHEVCNFTTKKEGTQTDGSGTELLRSKDVEEYLAEVCGDPAVAVLQEPVQEYPAPVRKCPNKLQIRQLFQYEPLSDELREKLLLSLKKYIENILKQEDGLEEMNLKEPRTEEEKENAANLLDLVKSFPKWEKSSEDLSAKAHITELYEHAVASQCPLHAEKRDTEQTVDPQQSFSTEEQSPVSKWQSKLQEHRKELDEGKKTLTAIRNKIIPPYFESESGKAFLSKKFPDIEALSKALPPVPQKESGNLPPETVKNFRRASECLSSTSESSPSPSLLLQTHSVQREGSSSTADLSLAAESQEAAFQVKVQSLLVNAAGQPRKEKVRLPSSLLEIKPNSIPHKKVEDPVAGRVNTSSLATPKQHLSGFHLIPPRVMFGVLKEGCTYAATVILKNVGIDFSRFRVKQPPPYTGLSVLYTPGPVAAGLQVELEIEIFAVSIGGESINGLEEICHDIEIVTETETLLLPVKALEE
ncbi:UNVERIFIED_CONTAM: hypothetical protein H355_014655 [Colinus virginianus]|nr:hypothetical protein H355_014655 [Colinus virginianus]